MEAEFERGDVNRAEDGEGAIASADDDEEEDEEASQPSWTSSSLLSSFELPLNTPLNQFI